MLSKLTKILVSLVSQVDWRPAQSHPSAEAPQQPDTEERGAATRDRGGRQCGLCGGAIQLYWDINPFMPTVPTFAVRETDVSRTANVERNDGHKWVKTLST